MSLLSAATTTEKGFSLLPPASLSLALPSSFSPSFPGETDEKRASVSHAGWLAKSEFFQGHTRDWSNTFSTFAYSEEKIGLL